MKVVAFVAFVVVSMGVRAVPSESEAPLLITDVQVDRVQFFPEKDESVKVSFQLSEIADVKLRWYDARDLLIREIVPSTPQSKKSIELIWDGNDEAGKPVPAGAYHYTIVATTEDGDSQDYDLSDLTQGDDYQIKDIELDTAHNQIKYGLSRLSRVNIRIGLKEGGPLLRSVVNWGVRTPGPHTEAWNGRDASGILDVSKNPNLDLWGMAFGLPENTVIVADPTKSHADVIEDLPWGEQRRSKGTIAPKRMYAHSQQTYEERGDFKVELNPVDRASNPGTGIATAISPEILSVRVIVPADWKRRIAQQRYELVYFLDGLFAFENEVGALPATWNVDTARLTPGEHYLIVNVRSYEGSFGYGAMKFRVLAAGKADSASNDVKTE